MKYTERVVIVGILAVFLGGGFWLYHIIKTEHQKNLAAVESGDYRIWQEESGPITQEGTEEWRQYYPVLVPLTIASTTVFASVASTLPERIQGLSGTPYLPQGIVKLFAFGTEGEHPIWMKDMNYPLDIIWVSRAGEVVHIEENISPDTFPKAFVSPVPAWYVIEANAGFVAAENIQNGDTVAVVLSEEAL